MRERMLHLVQGMEYLPSARFLTVQTAFGFPGNSDTAISVTSNPCLRTRNVDLGPLPQAE